VPENDAELPTIRLLEPADDVDGFVSGEDSIDEFLSRFAKPMQASGGPRTYAAVDNGRIVGYYSLVSGSIEREHAPERLAAGMGAYPIPTQVLARIGVHQDCHGAGLGGDLLLAALLTVVRTAALVGVRAVITHPLNHGPTGFYGRYGFRSFNDPNHDLTMYMLVKDVRKTLRENGLEP
jgi:GNAT superfamily N-acetyltransferase